MRIALALAIAAAAAVISFGSAEAQSTPDLDLSIFCDPDSMRPESEAVFYCVINVTSNEDEAIDGVTVAGNLAEGATLPSFEIFDRFVGGEWVFVSPGQTTFDYPIIPSQNTISSDSRIIFGTREAGMYGFHLDLLVDGVVVDGADLTFEATAASPYPPTGLTVTKTLVETQGDSPPPGEDLSPPIDLSPPQDLSPSQGFSLAATSATYVIEVTNTGDAPMQNIVLLDRRWDGARIAASDPPPDEDSAQTDIAMWDVGTLGLGDVFTARVTLENEPGGCASSLNTVVVEGRVGTDIERYHARADRGVVLGENCPLGQGGDGSVPLTDVVVLPSSGGTNGGDASSIWVWVVVGAGIAAFAFGLGTYRALR